MKETLNHSIASSVYLWLDNKFIEKGEGFVNASGNLNKFGNSYYFPYRQLVYDATVSGANFTSGSYVNGSFTGTPIDYMKGRALYTGNATVSGRCAAKEINLYMSSRSEQKVLFESRFQQNPKANATFTGYSEHDYVYPCAILKIGAGKNSAVSFDGGCSTIIPARIMLICENEYQYQAAAGLLRDSYETYIPLFSQDQLPFTSSGTLKRPFDYSASGSLISEDSNNLVYIKGVEISDFDPRVNNEIAPNAVAGFIDIELESLRFPRI